MSFILGFPQWRFSPGASGQLSSKSLSLSLPPAKLITFSCNDLLCVTYLKLFQNYDLYNHNN